MTKYKAYPEYKDSGVEWLGEIPAHWSIKRIKETASVISGYPFSSSQFHPEKGFPLVRIRDINAKRTEIFFDGYVPSEAKINTGDILVGMDGDFNVSWWESGEAALNQRVACIRTATNALTRFIFYTLPFNMKVVNDLTYFTTVKHLSNTDILKTTFALPSEDEINSIVIFLDHETAKIDNLINKQQQLIELLKEKRQAVINHAVTKGLNPDVPMKDSGNDLLGKMPVHWKLTPMRFLSDNITVGIVVTPAKYYIDNGIRCFRSLNISESKIKDAEWVYISEASNNLLSKSKVYTDDILVVRSGQPGTAAVVDHEFDSCNCIDLIIIRSSERFNSNYICMQINSVFIKKQVGMASDGAIQQHFNVEVAKALVVVEPPKHEQSEIFKFLSEKNKYFERLIERSELQITLLQERRTALISAAVTGKIDVRDWVAPDTQKTEETAA
ncbi:TPA: restriction endonuclease subunit S [Morganella morganii]